MVQNAMQIKEKIMSFFKSHGPNIPVRVAKHVDMSILFTSAFLSELLSEKQLTLSNMRVGSTPIYLIPGHEPQLEKFGLEYIKGKEKEALLMLKEKKFLEDKTQQPAIRVAFRELKDFAIPFKYQEEIFWRYFTTPQEEFKIPTQNIPQPKPKIKEEPKIEIEHKPLMQKIREAIKPAETETQKVKDIPDSIIESTRKGLTESASEQSPGPSSEQSINIFDKPIKKKPVKKKTSTASQKAQDQFFNTIKEHLSKSQIEIEDIIAFSKTDITLKVKDQNQEKLLIAFNKKRITETDFTDAHKKAQELKIPYIILSKGEPTKKLQKFIDAIKGMDKLEKVE